MGVTLNLTDEQARIVEHLVENELGGIVTGAVPGDETYETDLQNILQKLN